MSMDALERLTGIIKERGDLAVAFSGGVDSTLVALAALHADGVMTAGMMISNPTIPESEVENAGKVAKEIGLELRIIDVDVTEDPVFISNHPDRCGRCRTLTTPVLMRIASSLGFSTVADGANVDDLDDYRPGMKAATEMGMWHPLIEAGIGKSDARRILRERGISVHDRPSTPCLATRIPPDQPISRGKLKIIEEGEEVLKRMGFSQARFRLHEMKSGEMMGVVEVDDPVRAHKYWDDLILSLPSIDIKLDPKGYRQGSLNRVEDP